VGKASASMDGTCIAIYADFFASLDPTRSSCPSHVLIGMASIHTMQSNPDKDGVTYCNNFYLPLSFYGLLDMLSAFQM
jgi:hypothetical protein